MNQLAAYAHNNFLLTIQFLCLPILQLHAPTRECVNPVFSWRSKLGSPPYSIF
jgi:hypothetical protein